MAVQVTLDFYQNIIAAYDEPVWRDGKKRMYKLIKKIRAGAPKGLTELATLGRPLWRKRAAILAHFDADASNGLVEEINGRFEHLRDISLGSSNLDHYILRSLIHSGEQCDTADAL